MSAMDPISELPTHEVTNQPPHLENYNLFETDRALMDALAREGGAAHKEACILLGEELGRPETVEAAFQANRNPPELAAFDPYGRRIDEVRFHPAYHRLMDLAIRHGLPSVAWTAEKAGHVAHTALSILFIQIEQGVACPMAMTYAGVPVLKREPELAEEWVPKLLSREYDGRMVPVGQKAGATMGMAMTEKQGGSDVRSNTTRATPLGADGEYELTGHKWFCSAPMSDAFLTLAYTGDALSCFFVPRWRPDGTRNPFFIQRLKDKLGDKSNASSEIEYNGTWAQLVGEEGRGVPTIIEMVHHTRLDTSLAPAGMMRAAFVQAAHHVSHRRAFQKTLIDQPLMRNVIADLAVEQEAALALVMRVARAFDESAPDNENRDESAGHFARIAVAVSKYWLNKRLSDYVYEAMECLGGGGYVEESVMPRLFRQSPLNSIWEGSGNVICLDVLRAASRQPETLEALLAELDAARGGDKRLDAAIDRMKDSLGDTEAMETRARRFTEELAVLLQGSILVQNAPPAVADAFCASRLAAERGRTYGTLPRGADTDAIIERAWTMIG